MAYRRALLVCLLLMSCGGDGDLDNVSYAFDPNGVVVNNGPIHEKTTADLSDDPAYKAASAACLSN